MNYPTKDEDLNWDINRLFGADNMWRTFNRIKHSIKGLKYDI